MTADTLESLRADIAAATIALSLIVAGCCAWALVAMTLRALRETWPAWWGRTITGLSPVPGKPPEDGP